MLSVFSLPCSFTPEKRKTFFKNIYLKSYRYFFVVEIFSSPLPTRAVYDLNNFDKRAATGLVTSDARNAVHGHCDLTFRAFRRVVREW